MALAVLLPKAVVYRSDLCQGDATILHYEQVNSLDKARCFGTVAAIDRDQEAYCDFSEDNDYILLSCVSLIVYAIFQCYLPPWSWRPNGTSSTYSNHARNYMLLGFAAIFASSPFVGDFQILRVQVSAGTATENNITNPVETLGVNTFNGVSADPLLGGAAVADRTRKLF